MRSFTFHRPLGLYRTTIFQQTKGTAFCISYHSSYSSIFRWSLDYSLFFLPIRSLL